MELHDVRKDNLGRKRKFRVGRGPGSGLGKTCGRGQKGQKSRSGVSFRPYFEGGQMPNVRRLPKRGFNNKVFQTVYAPINVATLEKLFQDGETVEPKSLEEKGLLKHRTAGVKILGSGELKHKLTVRAHAFSRSAEEKIKAAGGTAEKIQKRKSQVPRKS